MLTRHFMMIPARLLLSLLRGKTEVLSGFFQAIIKKGELKKRRRDEAYLRTDMEIFKELKENLVFKQ